MTENDAPLALEYVSRAVCPYCGGEFAEANYDPTTGEHTCPLCCMEVSL